MHQGFSVVIDEITKEIQDEEQWCMIFTDDIGMVGEKLQEVNELDEWRLAFEEKKGREEIENYQKYK